MEPPNPVRLRPLRTRFQPAVESSHAQAHLTSSITDHVGSSSASAHSYCSARQHPPGICECHCDPPRCRYGACHDGLLTLQIDCSHRQFLSVFSGMVERSKVIHLLRKMTSDSSISSSSRITGSTSTHTDCAYGTWMETTTRGQRSAPGHLTRQGISLRAFPDARETPTRVPAYRMHGAA